MGISNYYSKLDKKDKSNFIATILELTGMRYPSFMRKMRTGTWTKLEREAIEKYIEEVTNERRRIL